LRNLTGRCTFLLPEQLSVVASSHKLQFIAGDSVNEQPIGLDMALSMAFPVPDQEMVSIAFIQRLLGDQRLDDRFQPGQIGASSRQTLHVASETRGLPKGERHRSAFPAGKQLGGRLENFTAAAFKLAHRFQRFRVGAPDRGLKRQAAGVYRLLQKHTDGVGGGQTERGENGLCLRFELRADP
jgi:hypothetical protein